MRKARKGRREDTGGRRLTFVSTSRRSAGMSMERLWHFVGASVLKVKTGDFRAYGKTAGSLHFGKGRREKGECEDDGEIIAGVQLGRWFEFL